MSASNRKQPRRVLPVCWPLALASVLACEEPVPAAPLNEPARMQEDASEQDTSTRAPLELDASASTPDAHSVTQLDAALALSERDASSAEAAFPIALVDANVQTPLSRSALVVPERWQILDAGADPFDDRPASIDCSTAGVVAETLSEERVLGVETGWCNYLTALQATQRAVQPGELIKVRLWHFELSAPEPAEAHAVVQVGNLRVLDERIAIPQPGGLIVKQVSAEQTIPAGTPVHFHLHNHGANSWALVEVSAGPPAPK